MEKYGFVYVWYDRKHKRYYVGSHWGREDDGYVCSSNWMRKTYRRRPNDFRRRIITKIYTSRHDLLLEEYRYLGMIKNHELGKRYYNLNNHFQDYWWSTEENLLTVGKKISLRAKTTETKKKIADGASRSWKDPKVREKRIKRRLETIENDPTFAKRLSDSIKASVDEKYRHRCKKAGQDLWLDSEYRERKTKEITDRWADETERAKLSEGMKRAWADQNKKERRSSSMRGKKKTPVSPEVLAQRIATRKANGWNKRSRSGET